MLGASVVSQVPLAAVATLVPRVLQEVGDEDLLSPAPGKPRLSLRRIGNGPRREPVVDPGLGRNPPRHQRGPAGRADGGADETILEPGATSRQPIDVGSSDHPIAVTPGHPGGQVVGNDEQDVGTPVLTPEQGGGSQGGPGQGCGRLQDVPARSPPSVGGPVSAGSRL